MKLRNKKTGEIVTPECFDFCLLKGVKNRGIEIKDKWYNSLKEISKDWEDYEEPKEYWYVDSYGMVVRSLANDNEWDERRKAIGNYFKTKEEAEKAVEKLKAWKRLKDAGFRFYKKWDSKSPEGPFYYVNIYAKIDPVPDRPDFMKDLDLLFGGEE